MPIVFFLLFCVGVFVLVLCYWGSVLGFVCGGSVCVCVVCVWLLCCAGVVNGCAWIDVCLGGRCVDVYFVRFFLWMFGGGVYGWGVYGWASLFAFLRISAQGVCM